MRDRAKYKILIFYLFAICFSNSIPAIAQSNLKEGNNQYALYSKSGDRKQLESARKFADEAYKTRRDTVSFRNNLLRALVYSTLSVVDSNRSLKYSEDPLQTSQRALDKLQDRQLLFENEPEINHIIRNLANGHLIKANQALRKQNYEEAYRQYRKVDSIDGRTYNVRPNLAVLSDRLGYQDEAAGRYEALTAQARSSSPAYIHALADIYEGQHKNNLLINVLQRGYEQFPEDRDILFRLINTFKKEQAFDAIVPLLPDALKKAPGNVGLEYLAAYAYDVTGDFARAKRSYERVIELDKNNYQGNYGIGLIYLGEFIRNPGNRTSRNKAEDYLINANKINPRGINALESLAVLYEAKGDYIQLERVKNIIDQLTLN